MSNNWNDIEAALKIEDRYLDDDGFTERVAAELPRRRRSWFRLGIVGGCTVVGALGVAWLTPFGDLLATAVQNPASLTNPVMLAAMIATALVLGGAVSVASEG